jgi:hypothetical protein
VRSVLIATSLAVAWAAGGAAQQQPVPTFGTTVVIPSGLKGDVYLLKKGTKVLPEFGRLKLKPEGTIWTTTLNVPPHHWQAGFPGVTKRFEWFAVNYTGRFWIEKPGRYGFALFSDDGSRLYIDDQLVVDNDCQHSPDVRGASAMLSGGIHRIRVAYFQGPRDCVALMLGVAPPDGEWRVFSTDDFKPPSNPEEWKYAKEDDLSAGKDAAAASLEVEELNSDEELGPFALAEVLRTGGGRLAFGCAVVPPSRSCGM